MVVDMANEEIEKKADKRSKMGLFTTSKITFADKYCTFLLAIKIATKKNIDNYIMVSFSTVSKAIIGHYNECW